MSNSTYSTDVTRIKILHGDILDVDSGVIMQQVNCQNAYGAGISGVISRKYPAVELDYRESFKRHTGDELFGSTRIIRVSPTLIVANSYSQFYHGNAMRTGKVYTDMDKLVSAITDAAQTYDNVYVPYGIGCCLAGGNWDELYARIKHLPITVVKLN